MPRAPTSAGGKVDVSSSAPLPHGMGFATASSDRGSILASGVPQRQGAVPSFPGSAHPSAPLPHGMGFATASTDTGTAVASGTSSVGFDPAAPAQRPSSHSSVPLPHSMGFATNLPGQEGASAPPTYGVGSRTAIPGQTHPAWLQAGGFMPESRVPAVLNSGLYGPKNNAMKPQVENEDVVHVESLTLNLGDGCVLWVRRESMHYVS
jgi:hypothetical protein